MAGLYTVRLQHSVATNTDNFVFLVIIGNNDNSGRCSCFVAANYLRKVSAGSRNISPGGPLDWRDE